MGEDIQQPPRRIYKKRTTVKKESLTGMVKPTSGRGGGAVIRGRGPNSQRIVSLPRRENSNSSHERTFPQQPSSQFNNYTELNNSTDVDLICGSSLSMSFPQSHAPGTCQITRKQELVRGSYEPTLLQNSWFTDPVSQSYAFPLSLDSTWTSLGLHLPHDEWDSQRDMEETDSGSDSSTTLSYSTSSSSSPVIPSSIKKSVKFALDHSLPLEPELSFQYIFSQEAEMFSYDHSSDEDNTQRLSR
jgi:hypothetical protein